MDKGAWQSRVHGLQIAGHDWARMQEQIIEYIDFWLKLNKIIKINIKILCVTILQTFFKIKPWDIILYLGLNENSTVLINIFEGINKFVRK